MHSRSLRFGVAGAGLLLIGSVAAWMLMRPGDPPAELVAAVSEPNQPAPMDSTAESKPEGERTTPARKPTIRDYLMEFYGDSWDRVRASVEDTLGTRLDNLLEDDPVKPWEEVAAEIRGQIVPTADKVAQQADSLVDWDPARLASWDSVRASFRNVPEDMRDLELQEFRAIAAAENEKIRDFAMRRGAVLTDLCAFKWSKGDFAKSPFCPPPDNEPGNSGRIAVAQCYVNSSTGWIVRMQIYADELPKEYDELGRAIRQGPKDRTAKLNQYLASKQ